MRFFVLLLAARASGLAVRLNKLLPGLSRRKADAAIADGRVTVDGVVADGRTPVERGSEVRLDGDNAPDDRLPLEQHLLRGIPPGEAT